MNCDEKYFEWMNRAIDGDLDGEELAALEAHLAACSACRSLYDALRRMAAEAAALEVEPPADLSEKIMGRVRTARRRSPVRVLRWTMSLAGAAAVLVTVFLGGRLILHGASNSKADAAVFYSSNGAGEDGDAPQASYAVDEEKAGEDMCAPRDPELGTAGESASTAPEETTEADGNTGMSASQDNGNAGVSAKTYLHNYGLDETEYHYVLILAELPEELEGRDYDMAWDGSRLYTLSNTFAESLMCYSSQYMDQGNTAAQSLVIWNGQTP